MNRSLPTRPSHPPGTATATGLTLPELLVGVVVLGLLAALSIGSSSELLARQRLEAATRRLALGIDRGRASAQRDGLPCSLSLGDQGWQEGTLEPACSGVSHGFGQGVSPDHVQVNHNLPDEVRFTTNGLLLDGGTVVLSADGTPLRRCLVVSLPLGIVRVGRYGADPGGAPDAGACKPDPTL